MADFWGDILSSVSSVGDDIDGFFTSTIGQATARGLAGATSGQKKDKLRYGEGFLPEKMYGDFTPGRESQAPTSKDFHEVEKQWLLRMKKFSGLSDETAVRLGAK